MMKTNQELFNERLIRLQTAIAAQEKPDKVPVEIMAGEFCAKHMGVKYSEFYTDTMLSNKTILDSVSQLGDVSGIGTTFASAYFFNYLWLSKVKFAGHGLPENMPLQIDEQELLKAEDYDRILNMGWSAFVAGFFEEHFPTGTFGKFLESANASQAAYKNTIDAGYVPFMPGAMNSPFDSLSGPRSMTSFLRDLYKIPDKVEAVLDLILEDNIAMIKNLALLKPITIFIGGARCSSAFLSPKLWERFQWKYVLKLAEAIHSIGSVPYFHFDGDWLRDIHRFRELPKGKIVVGADGTNDIYKYREILGDGYCILGDVNPSLLVLGDPDEVYNHCVKLCKEIGPKGFILAAGCTVPENAKLENVKAMVAAASGK